MAKSTVAVKFTGDLKNLERSIGKAESKLGKVGKVAAAGVALVGTGVVAAGAGLIKLGESFDSAYDKIRVGTGATGDALEGLQSSFKNVFSQVPTDMESASTAIADLNTRLGITGKPLEDLSKQMLELSRITGTDLGSNIESVTRVFGDWGIAAEDQAATLDALFRASQATGIGVDTLSQQMVKFGAPLRQLGFGFDETAALLGKFEKEGVNAELVMGSMRIALGKMARDGEPAQETLQRVTDDIKNAGSASEANALALELFGARAGPDMAAAIREGRFELGDLYDTVADGSETVMGAAADTQDFGEKWTLLKNRVLVALEPVARKVFDGIGQLMDRLGPKVDQLVSWFEQNLVPAFQTVQTWVEANWPKIQQTITNAVQAVSDTVTPIIGALQALWDNFGNNILEFVQRVWPAIQQVITGVMNTIQGIIKTVTALIRGDWSKVWEGLKQTFSGVWNAIQGIARAALEAIRGILGIGLEIIGSVFRGAWEGIKNWFGGLPKWFSDTASRIWNGLKNGLGAAIDWVKEKLAVLIRPIQAIIDKVNQLKSGVTIGGSGDFGLTNRFEGRAFGGPVKAGVPYLVGDRFGPNSPSAEVFVPSRDGTILPRRPSTPQSGPAIHIENVHLGNGTPRDLADELAWMWRLAG